MEGNLHLISNCLQMGTYKSALISSVSLPWASLLLPSLCARIQYVGLLHTSPSDLTTFISLEETQKFFVELQKTFFAANRKDTVRISQTLQILCRLTKTRSKCHGNKSPVDFLSKYEYKSIVFLPPPFACFSLEPLSTKHCLRKTNLTTVKLVSTADSKLSNYRSPSACPIEKDET